MSSEDDRLELGREVEGVEVGRRARLPRNAEPPYAVFVNGVRQREGPDYRVEGREIVFKRPIVKEGKVSGLRWFAMLLGLFGTYRRHEVVDRSEEHTSELQSRG